MAQRDAVLRLTRRMEGVLNRDAHLLEGEHGVTAQVARGIRRHEVEVAHLVHGNGRVVVGEVIVFELRADVHDVSGRLRLAEHATQALARIALEIRAVGLANVAEHAGHAVVRGTPGKHLERGRVREGEHVGLLGRGESFDGRAVEADALLEGNLEVFGANGEALEPAEHIGKPEMHKADAALLDGAKNEIDVLLLIHEPVSSLILGFTQYTHVPVHCAIGLFQ